MAIFSSLPGAPRPSGRKDSLRRDYADLTSVKELATSITQWVNTWNDNPRPYVWHKTADEIFDSLAAYCERTYGSGH